MVSFQTPEALPGLPGGLGHFRDGLERPYRTTAQVGGLLDTQQPACGCISIIGIADGI